MQELLLIGIDDTKIHYYYLGFIGKTIDFHVYSYCLCLHVHVSDYFTTTLFNFFYYSEF